MDISGCVWCGPLACIDHIWSLYGNYPSPFVFSRTGPFVLGFSFSFSMPRSVPQFQTFSIPLVSQYPNNQLLVMDKSLAPTILTKWSCSGMGQSIVSSLWHYGCNQQSNVNTAGGGMPISLKYMYH